MNFVSLLSGYNLPILVLKYLFVSAAVYILDNQLKYLAYLGVNRFKFYFQI